MIKRVDVAWPQIRTILEFDGADYHDLTGARAEDQRVRDHLRALGWVVEVACRADVDGPRLRDVVGRVRAAVDRWERVSA